jgi:3'-phosphoadenosine 5'-phosphosulfate (PAPS) 3'-phosphatase
MQPRHRILLPTITLALLGALPLAGCVGAPVQEMSNARQAVRAAQQAGGAKYSPESMAEAERLLKNAKTNQSKGEYRVAREEAEQARDKAMVALREAEAAKASKPGP